jgi:2,3-bisphosphoglycerate-dependent phosphoglycerate mutase
LARCERSWIPVRRSWRLNERHYGALQGKDKKETREEFGDELLQQWRRSYDVPPPPLEWDPSADPRYRHLPAELVPKSECLADVVARMMPYWYDAIVPDLALGRITLVAAHGNSLRALKMHLEGLTPDEILEVNIGTGQPLVYELDERFAVKSHGYLDPEAAAAAAEAVAKQAG